jgi:type VI secretion system secreted protein Hcp
MSINFYLKFDGIDGESVHVDHKGEIEASSWSWGLDAPTTGTGGSGGAVGKPRPREFHFVHYYDKASPLLAKNAALGKHVKTAVLSARKAGEQQKDYLKVTMTDVIITSVSISGDGNGPMEEVAMAFNEIDVSYQPQDPKGGLGPAVKFDWNIKTGKVT